MAQNSGTPSVRLRGAAEMGRGWDEAGGRTAGFAGGEEGTSSQSPVTRGWQIWDSRSHPQELHKGFPCGQFLGGQGPGATGA